MVIATSRPQAPPARAAAIAAAISCSGTKEPPLNRLPAWPVLKEQETDDRPRSSIGFRRHLTQNRSREGRVRRARPCPLQVIAQARGKSMLLVQASTLPSQSGRGIARKTSLKMLYCI